MALSCVLLALSLASSAQPVNVIPVNVAEAIFEPFWSPELSGFSAWTVQPGTAYGLQIKQNWSVVDFEWASKPESGPALRMWRDVEVDCAAYDRLIVRLTAPKNAIVRIIAQTDKGERGQALLHMPDDCAIRVETLALFGGEEQQRITIHKQGTSGTLEVSVQLMRSDARS